MFFRYTSILRRERKMNKKYLAVLFALVVSLSVSVGVFAQDPFAVTWDEETVLTVFNDVNLVFPDMFAPEDSDFLWTEDDTETIPNFDLHAKDVSAEEVDLEAKTGIFQILKVNAAADPCGDGLIKVDVEFSKDPAASGPKKTTYIRSINVKWGSNYLDIVKCESTGADSCRSVKFNNKGIAKMTLYVYSDTVIDDSISDLGSVTVTLEYSNYMTALFPVASKTVSGSGKLTRDMKKNYCQAQLTEFDPRSGKSVSAVRAKYDQNTGEARFQATVANISGGKNQVFKSYFMIPAEIMVDYKKDGFWYTSHYKDYTCKYTIYNNFNGAMMTDYCKYGEGIPMYENALVRFDITIENLGNEVLLAYNEGDIPFSFRVGGMKRLVEGIGNGAFKVVDFPCPKETRMAALDPIKPFMTFYGIDQALYDNPIKPSGPYGVYEGGVWGLYQKCGTYAYLAVRLRNDGMKDEVVDLNHVAVAINGGTPVNWKWVLSTVDADENKIELAPTEEVILFARVKVTNIPAQLNADVPMTGAVNFMDYGFYITGKVFSDHNNTNCVAAPQ